MRAYPGQDNLSGWRLGVNENVRHLFGPSGGLSYHLSALRYRHLWRGFLTKVKHWLEQWTPPENNLMIFGASAGWSIPPQFLERFDSIVIVEPDPMARALLRRRFPKVQRWRMINDSDLLPWLSGRPGRFAEFLEKWPDHAILFSNLLGQIPLVWKRPLEADEWSNKNSEFLEAVKNRSWASYHDIISAHRRPSLSERAVEALVPERNVNALAKKIWNQDEDLEAVVDHGTEWLISESYALWHLRPHTYHLIGFYQSKR